MTAFYRALVGARGVARRLHVHEVKPLQPQGMTTPTSHKRLNRQRRRPRYACRPEDVEWDEIDPLMHLV